VPKRAGEGATPLSEFDVVQPVLEAAQVPETKEAEGGVSGVIKILAALNNLQTLVCKRE
jgi:hypothetical protein